MQLNIIILNYENVSRETYLKKNICVEDKIHASLE